MSLHASTFEYHKPSDRQILTLAQARTAAADYALQLEELVPDGADKTYALRRLRELAMWVNVAITREADGTPRQD